MPSSLIVNALNQSCLRPTTFIAAALLIAVLWVICEETVQRALDFDATARGNTAPKRIHSLPRASSQESDLLELLPRAFERWPAKQPIPCTPAPDDWIKRQNIHELITEGLFFTKLYKCASTTSTSVHLRVARNIALLNGYNHTVCDNYFGHNGAGLTDGQAPYAHATRFQQRDSTKSFLWTTLRQPTKRYISQYFYAKVSRAGLDYSDRAFRKFLSRSAATNTTNSYYLRALTTRGFDSNKDDPAAAVAQIFRDYNFMALVERFDESIVAFMMILNLNVGDVLFLDSKSHDGYADATPFTVPRVECFKVKNSFVTEAMQEYFDTDPDWKAHIHWDNVIYDAANKSLDRTIDHLGRQQFDANLRLFREASAVAHERCKEHATFACPPVKQEMTCIGSDIACGQKCLDSVVHDMGIGISFDLSGRAVETFDFKTRIQN